MPIMLEKLYDAFIAAKVPDDKARAAAVESAEMRDQIVDVRSQINDVKSTLRLHSWMLATNTALVLLLLGLALRPAHSQQAQSTFTDRSGHFAGSSITHGPKTDFYDARGRYQGTTTQQGTPSNPLGNVNGSDPFGRARR